MSGELKTFEAVFAERSCHEWRVVTVVFRTEDESDAYQIAEDIALLEGTKLIGILPLLD